MKPIVTALIICSSFVLPALAFAEDDAASAGVTIGMSAMSPTGSNAISGPRAGAASRSVGGAGTAATISEDVTISDDTTTAATDQGITVGGNGVGSTTNVTAGATGSSSQGTGGMTRVLGQ